MQFFSNPRSTVRGNCRLLATAECVPQIYERGSAVATTLTTVGNYGGLEKLIGLLPCP